MLDQAPLLRRTLLLNALFSGTCGLLLMVFPAPLTDLLGGGAPALLRSVGAGLLAFAVHLAWASRRGIPVLEARYFVVSDLAWVAGTLGLLVVAPESLSVVGRALVVGVALAVGNLARLQARGLEEAREALRVAL